MHTVDMELNGYHCGDETEDENTTPHSRTEVASSVIATPSLESSFSQESGLGERRVSNASSGRQRLDSLKKNRPRRCFHRFHFMN